MVRSSFLLRAALACMALCSASLSFAQQFKFAFLTDLHIRNDATMDKVGTVVQALPADIAFILTGGDNVDVDGLSGGSLQEREERYRAFKNMLDRSEKPYHVAIGNHDRLPKDIRDSVNQFQVFTGNFGSTYYTFDHQGYRFIVLNSVYTDSQNEYVVPGEQQQWLEQLLARTPHHQPLIVVSHVPFLSVYYPVLQGRYTGLDTFKNQKKIFDLFSKHRLKLVLQGHMHLYEEIKVKDVSFVTAGAICGNWWMGAFHGTKPGYLEVAVDGEQLSWSYKPY